MLRNFRIVLGFCMLLACGFAAQAQEAKFPSKPIKVLVPFSPGALTDVIARIYAEKLTQRLGQAVIVENRPGSGGVLASQAMLAAPADGYTLQMVSSSHAVNPTLYAKLPYDTVRDIAGVALVASSPSVVVVSADLGAKSLKDLISIARQQPGKLNYGSAGVGAATHLVGEYLRSQAQIDIVHIPYKGVQEAVAEVMAGRIQIAFPPIALAMNQMRAGKVVGLAVTSAERSALIPDVPTAQESGLPGFEYSIWYALVAPARVPRPILEQVAKEVQQVGALPDVREKMISQGLIPKAVVLHEFDTYIQAEIDKLGKLIRASGAKAE
ncbi:MAG: tripartite tricarboxylate transporter substrate binding protein [Proteobacteria bacterium]|nr:tripartite tricarboxylate transporter substrate binding protein [Pseudomonadota bacterium]